MKDEEIRRVYRGLAKIEDSFKITKTFFESRPQFTYYDEVIDACGKALDMNLKKKYRTQQEVQRLLRY